MKSVAEIFEECGNGEFPKGEEKVLVTAVDLEVFAETLMGETIVKTQNERVFASGGLKIPFEVADGITLANLVDHVNMLKEEVRKHVEEGSYMHPEDYHYNMVKLIPSLEVLIKYYGG